MTRYGFLYYTENEDDAGYRVVEAVTVAEAKAIHKANILAEGTHGATYRLDAIVLAR